MIDFYKSKLLDKSKGLFYGFAPFKTQNKVSLDLSGSNKEDFNFFLEKSNIFRSQVCLVRQVHKSDILVLKDSDDLIQYGQQHFDSIVTNKPGILLGIRTADCIPLLLYDPKTKVVAAIHGGWRSTAKKIGIKVLQKMKEGFGVDPTNVLVAMGPGICKKCFEVEKDVIVQFEREVSEIRDDSKYILDLYAAHKDQLVSEGVNESNIDCLEECTFHLENGFFSHRKDQTKKRHLNFIMLK